MLSLPRTRSRAERLVLCWFGALLIIGVASTCCAAAAAEKPNFLFIAVDDLNHWVGYLGRNPRTKTPHIDRLAGMGTSFTNSHCVAHGLQSVACGVDVRDASGDHRLLSQSRLLEAADSRGQERGAHAADLRVSHDRDGKDFPLRQLLRERVGCLPATSGSGPWCRRRQDGGFSRSARARPARRRSGGLAHGRLLHRAIAAGAHAAVLSGVWAAQAAPAVCRAAKVLRTLSAGEYRTAALSGG